MTARAEDDGEYAAAAGLIAAAAQQGLWIATAESLTAGALVARLVDVPGASAVIAGGATCYSYSAKTRLLGVDPLELQRHGAVSAQVAAAMAEGALRLYAADLAISTTGVAGPGADDRGVAAGTVFLGLAGCDRATRTRALRLPGDRRAVRRGTVAAAIAELAKELRPLEGRRT